MIKAYEIPTKKNVSRKVIDVALDEYVEKSSFTIKLEDGDKTAEITFRTYQNPLDTAVFVQQAPEIGIKKDEVNNYYYIDYVGLELTTHAFILNTMSTLPDMQVERDGESNIDVKNVGGYGAFFALVSKNYDTLFDLYYQLATRVCQERVDVLNNGLLRLTNGADMAKLIADPNFMAQLKDIVMQGIQ